jgi:hypothetical protein
LTIAVTVIDTLVVVVAINCHTLQNKVHHRVEHLYVLVTGLKTTVKF